MGRRRFAEFGVGSRGSASVRGVRRRFAGFGVGSRGSASVRGVRRRPRGVRPCAVGLRWRRCRASFPSLSVIVPFAVRHRSLRCSSSFPSLFVFVPLAVRLRSCAARRSLTFRLRSHVVWLRSHAVHRLRAIRLRSIVHALCVFVPFAVRHRPRTVVHALFVVPSLSLFVRTLSVIVHARLVVPSPSVFVRTLSGFVRMHRLRAVRLRSLRCSSSFPRRRSSHAIRRPRAVRLRSLRCPSSFTRCSSFPHFPCSVARRPSSTRCPSSFRRRPSSTRRPSSFPSVSVIVHALFRRSLTFRLRSHAVHRPRAVRLRSLRCSSSFPRRRSSARCPSSMRCLSLFARPGVVRALLVADHVPTVTVVVSRF
jgi:hypothetical protein